ncbi:hypothetical protein M0805_000788 [Coniferiporia weirii]|nr:hypothetical protein M0805_000788 [Coniferiporia weirii]
MLLARLSTVFVAALSGVVRGHQAVLDVGIEGFGEPESTMNFTTMHLASLQATDSFTTLVHPRFPTHQVRIKKSDFCDPAVNVYTGYLDVDYGAKHMFFYFFESRRNPDEDDVMMWINGGPGCSSSLGLLMELGPCSIDMSNSSSNGTVWNPHGWNNEANIFFLDQPVGVGFSYADYGQVVETTEEAAKNVHAFISIFFETFSQFKGRRLHLSGESYGGRYLPVFASEIVDQNVLAASEGRPTLNLTSVLIGNGITDISTLYPGRFEVECGTASLDVPFQSIATCVRMKQALPRCVKAMKESCVDTFDTINCNAAVDFCDSQLSTGYWASGRNVYDISKMCVGDSLCYHENTAIEQYLNNASLRMLLGVSAPQNFTSCASGVGAGFRAHMDKYAAPTQEYVGALLGRGVSVLIYAGTYDWQCNWVANKLWVERLEWAGQDAFNTEEWRTWGLDDGDAGITKTAGPLTFATIWGAGHMVPHDKPAEAMAMVSRWLAGKEL